MPVIEADSVRRKHRNVAVLQEYHIARVSQDSRDIAGYILRTLTETDHQRAVMPRAEDFSGLLCGKNAQRIAAFQHAVKALKRLSHIAVVQTAKKMCDDLCIGLRTENNALFL